MSQIFCNASGLSGYFVKKRELKIRIKWHFALEYILTARIFRHFFLLQKSTAILLFHFILKPQNDKHIFNMFFTRQFLYGYLDLFRQDFDRNVRIFICVCRGCGHPDVIVSTFYNYKTAPKLLLTLVKWVRGVKEGVPCLWENNRTQKVSDNTKKPMSNIIIDHNNISITSPECFIVSYSIQWLVSRSYIMFFNTQANIYNNGTFFCFKTNKYLINWNLQISYVRKPKKNYLSRDWNHVTELLIKNVRKH